MQVGSTGGFGLDRGGRIGQHVPVRDRKHLNHGGRHQDEQAQDSGPDPASQGTVDAARDAETGQENTFQTALCKV